MIKFAMKCRASCDEGAVFEVWFRSNEDCEAQLAAGHVTCPTCGSPEVEKALMTPGVSRAHRRDAPKPSPASAPAATTAPVGAKPQPTPSPAEAAFFDARRRALETKLRALRAEVEAKAEYVGRDFAAEARRIDDGEADERAIYGEATPAEVEDLVDSGLPVTPIPWISRRDDA